MIKREWLLGVGLLSGGIGIGLGSMAGTMIGAQPAEAQSDGMIGAVAAVKPDAFGTPPNAAEETLDIGANLVENEKIRTGETGTANVIFTDRSTLTVGKGSEVVLDKFVYDPASRSGELAVSIGQGALRFIGGQLSKTGSVQIKTQTATLTVRGGIVVGARQPDGSFVFVFIYGTSLTENLSGQSIYRPGFAFHFPADGGPPGAPYKISDADLANILRNFNTETGVAGEIPDSQLAEIETHLGDQDARLIDDLRDQVDDMSQRDNTVLNSLRQFMVVDTLATS
jgi:hypothetical protein